MSKMDASVILYYQVKFLETVLFKLMPLFMRMYSYKCASCYFYLSLNKRVIYTFTVFCKLLFLNSLITCYDTQLFCVGLPKTRPVCNRCTWRGHLPIAWQSLRDRFSYSWKSRPVHVLLQCRLVSTYLISKTVYTYKQSHFIQN